MPQEFQSILELLRNQSATDNDPVYTGIPAYGEIEGLDAAHLAEMRRRRWLTTEELLAVYAWKEGGRNRRIQDIRRNLEGDVDFTKQLSVAAFASDEEYKRISILDRLHGVGIAVASVILTVLAPETYGIIDIRVWRLLYEYGEVDHDPEGRELTLESWLDYLPKVRHWAAELGVSAREVERRLFEYEPGMADVLSYDTSGMPPTAQLKESAATPFMVHLDSVLDQIDQLPLEQQEILADVLYRRRVEQARKQIAADARESLALFHAGKLQARPVEEVIASLEAALAEPDDE
jgi:hypothetical protein